MIKIDLPIYYTIEYKTKKDKTILIGLNWYRNVHYMLNNKVKKYYHNIIKEKLNGTKQFKNKINITYKIYLKRRGSDFHNVRSVVEKYILDGLISAGIIVDDTDEYINIIKTIPMGVDKNNPRLELLIEEHYE
jgi:hypothetical protein